MGACTRTDLRTTASSAAGAMLLSCGWFFNGGLKAGHGFGPHLVKVSAKAGDALGMERVETARAVAGVEDEAGMLEDLEVLRDGGTRDGEMTRELVDGEGAGSELLKDGHARGVGEGIESGFEVGIHSGKSQRTVSNG